MTRRLITDKLGITRCAWCMGDPAYIEYHDREWGFPVADDDRLFEKICLEGFQAGLSWLTILRKRENFRSAFHGFEITRVARMNSRDVARLLRDPGIVRHRGKIESAINNARCAMGVIESEGTLASFIWRFAPARQPKSMTWARVSQPSSRESIALSAALRNRGWSFVGPTTMQAFMQAMGLVNHHLTGCHAREMAAQARERFHLPA